MAERGLLPYVVLSQTVPLIALAPLIVGWGGRLTLFGIQWKPWMSVAVIAAYLAFFPVAVGALRGLQAPERRAVELMDSYAASWRQTLLQAALPAAVPYLVPALKLAAAVGGGGRGRGGDLDRHPGRHRPADHRVLPGGHVDPAKVYTAMIGAAVLGLVVAGLVGLRRPGHAAPPSPASRRRGPARRDRGPAVAVGGGGQDLQPRPAGPGRRPGRHRPGDRAGASSSR